MATALNGVTAVSASSETTDHTSWESDHGLVLPRNHNYDGFYRGNASTEPAPADPLMFLTLDFAKTSRLPLYLQIAQHIQSAIETDDLTQELSWATRSSSPRGSECPVRPCAGPFKHWLTWGCWFDAEAWAPR